SPHDLGVLVGREIGPLLSRQRYYDRRVVVAMRGNLVGLLSTPDLQRGPFGPDVHARGKFDELGDMGAANPRRGLEKVEAPLAIFDELGVRSTAHETKGADDLAVELGERLRVHGVALERPGREDAAAVRDVVRRSPVSVRNSEDDLVLGD